MIWLWLGCVTVSAQTNLSSTLIEAAGQVEIMKAATTNWLAASAGLTLQVNDKVRTRSQSRAAVQLGDRSVVRLDELTTLEILPARAAEKKRFGLWRGTLYFFNREKPADVEFDTPLAAGAIRGTEFSMSVADNSALNLALIDGLVSLKSATEEINLSPGEAVEMSAGQPAKKTALINATAKIQWALYYPAIVSLDELTFTDAEKNTLAEVVNHYRAGDVLGALAAWPDSQSISSVGANLLHAQLELAVGRVELAKKWLTALPENNIAKALQEIINVVRLQPNVVSNNVCHSASEWLARSYTFQAAMDLEKARMAAKAATVVAPDFGFAHARLAELEFAFGHRLAAHAELTQALQLSPRLAAAYALQGFVWLDENDGLAAQKSFEQARELDAALGLAWLGNGLCLLHERDFVAARKSFQVAAALEPQRSLFRSYLGKAASDLGEAKAAEKEFRLAKQLDANDPTAWLYSALHLWSENKLNAAILDLEKSHELNGNRAAFRSRELLDADKAVRSANLAAIYDDAGLTEVSRRVAARAVSESYANFSGHLLLANSLAAQEDAARFDLRWETARQSELLVANLLAPPGAGNLSQVLSQSDRLRFFNAQAFGMSSLTSYGSRGDWSETATMFGSTKKFSYALDTAWQNFNGQRVNNHSEQRAFALTLKSQVTTSDDLYLQVEDLHNRAGDVAKLYDPNHAKVNFQVREKKEPDIYAGWHHEWTPGSHTLVLVSRLNDRLTIHDDLPNVLTLRQIGGVVSQAAYNQLNAVPLILDDRSGFMLYSAELQQLWESAHQSFIFGGRWQTGEVKTGGTLAPAFASTVNFTDQSGQGNFRRGNAYGYYSLRPWDNLTLTGGASFDHLDFPENADFAPVSLRETSREQISPKAGVLFSPWKRGLFRAGYTRSLGGLFFDNSVRLEPTQVGGFNQAFRSLIPESAAGLLAGAEFETASLGFDQSFARGTFFGLEAEWLASKGERVVGTITNSTFLPIYDSPGGTRQHLDFHEQNLSAYAAQLLGDFFSVSARYRLSEAKLLGEFPDLPRTVVGLSQLEQNNRAVLNQVSFALNLNLPAGIFAQWESSWYHQNNFGYSPGLPETEFWQHNFMLGYRFAHRHAELRLGVLNIFGTDYRLNPLNLTGELPRTRWLTTSLRLNF